MVIRLKLRKTTLSIVSFVFCWFDPAGGFMPSPVIERASLLISWYQPLEMAWNQFWIFLPSFFWPLSWAVMAQNEILSPHSQTTYSDPIVWSAPLAAESTTGLFKIVLLHSGHVIWFSIFFPFFVTVNIELSGQTDSLLLQPKQPDWCKPFHCASCILPSKLLHPPGTCPSWWTFQHLRFVPRTQFSDLVLVRP